MITTDHRERYEVLLADLAAAALVPPAHARMLAYQSVVLRASVTLASPLSADMAISIQRIHDTAKTRMRQASDALAKQPPIFEARS